MAAQIKRCLWLFMFLLAGCGVRVEIATPVQITAAPRGLPPLDNFTGNGVWRVQAAPRIMFTEPDRVSAQLFMQTDQRPVYMLQYRALWLAVEYDATWFDAPGSNALLRLNVYRRSDTATPWELYDDDQRTLATDHTPVTSRDTIIVMVYADEVGEFDVRAEVNLVAYPEDGTIVTQVSSTEIHVHVLADPGNIAVDHDALAPQMDDSGSWILLDWRGWLGGPCAYMNTLASISAACDSLNSGDYASMGGYLSAALNETDDSDLYAALNSMQGLALAALGNYSGSAAHLEEAIRVFEELGRFWELTIQLHNMGAVEFMRENANGAYPVFDRLQEMRGQFYDQAGIMLTQANIAYLESNIAPLEEAHYYMREEWGLPQAGIVEAWLNTLYESQ